MSEVDEAWRQNSSFFSVRALLTEEVRRDDLIAVASWLVMLSYALISNILILIGIARSTTMRAATSYWFIISLAVCDIIMSIISLVHLLPATAFHSAYVEYRSWRNVIMLFCYDLFWYTAVLQLGLMAGNRFVSIVYPMEYKWMFSRRKSLFIIAFGYFLGFVVSLPTLFPCCHTLWNSDYYITVYEPMDTWYKYVDMSVNSLSLILMILSYAVIIYKVRESGRAMAKYQLTIRTRQQNALMNGVTLATTRRDSEMNGCGRASSVRPPRSQVSKKEMRLFIQFFLVSVVFLMTWTTWQWLPHISTSKWAYFLMTSLFFINNSVNPTVYLLFNTQLRHELHYLLCRPRAVSERGGVRLRRPSMIFGRQSADSANRLVSRKSNNNHINNNNNKKDAGDRNHKTLMSSTCGDGNECLVRSSICSTSSASSIVDRPTRAHFLGQRIGFYEKRTISAV